MSTDDRLKALGGESPDAVGYIRSVVEPLVRGFNDAAVVVSPDHKAILFNQPFATMTGLGRRALTKKVNEQIDVYELLGSDTGVDREAVDKCFEANRVYRLAELPVRNGAGQPCLVWYSVTPFADPCGKVLAVIAVFRDVSAEARMQTRFKELLALSRARAEDLERLVELRTRELSAAFEEVRRLSRTDPLTGLLNRRAFAEMATVGLDAAKRHMRQGALLMCDLDHFKRVNDHYGHRVGDVVLVSCAQVLKSSFRNVDAIGRFGGEEFIVYLSDTTADGAMEAATRCKDNLEQFKIQNPMLTQPLVQTGSFGVAVYPDHGTSLDELLTNADQALYAAKKMGRNRVLLSGIAGANADFATGESSAVARLHAVDQPGSETINEPERVLIIDPDEQRLASYKRILSSDYDVVTAATTIDALDFCRGEPFNVFVADMSQSEHSGLFLLGEILSRQPGAIRVLMVENAAPFEQLLGTNLATIDYVLLRDDFELLPEAIENCRTKRDSYRDNPLARSPQPSRWVLHSDDMSRIVDEKRFGIAYQPIVRCPGRDAFGYEVLCRVHSKYTVGLVDLFDWALREGEIWNLGRLIRRQAVPRLLEGGDDLYFFNLHPAELFDPEFANHDPDLDPHAHRIVFEITERAAIGDFERMRTAMRRLRHRGYRFAIDDLGAGYAGLNSVAMLSPDFIKVDMTIIRDIDKWPVKARLLKRIVEFAEEEGVHIVAEGIETAGEEATVAELGCHLCQGFLIGTPICDDENVAPSPDPDPADPVA